MVISVRSSNRGVESRVTGRRGSRNADNS